MYALQLQLSFLYLCTIYFFRHFIDYHSGHTQATVKTFDDIIGSNPVVESTNLVRLNVERAIDGFAPLDRNAHDVQCQLWHRHTGKYVLNVPTQKLATFSFF